MHHPSRSIVVVLALFVSLLATVSLASPARANQPQPETRADTTSNPPNPYKRSDIIMWSTLTLGALHHTDHVLRDNHSGFPFTKNVNEFTASLAIYPIILSGHFFDLGPNYWITVESAALIGLGLAHTLVEPPSHQHDPWANGTNLLGVESKALGRTSQTISVLLWVGIAAHLGSSIADGVKCGFTWKDQESCGDKQQRSQFGLSPTRKGARVFFHHRW